LADFLVIIDNITDYSKSDIDKGNTPPDVYKLCSCIRETFCLSYSIRNNNNLFIYVKDDYLLIKLEGKSLRYMGSDERSQAILLSKALNKLKNSRGLKSTSWLNSTPGIFIRRLNDHGSLGIEMDFERYCVLAFVGNLNEKSLDLVRSDLDFSNYSNDFLYIMIVRDDLIEFIWRGLQNLNNQKVKLINLSHIKSIENKILYINFQIDQREIVPKPNS